MIEGLELHPALREACLSAAAAWSKGRSWHGVSAGDAPAMRVALRLAQAVVEGRHVGLDYRTFSKRVAGNSKSLEESEALVLRLVRTVVDLPADIPSRAALALLGIERFGPPLLIAGNFQIGGGDVGGGLPYVGIPPEAAARIDFRRLPQYVLTIENFASFNRHVLEADPGRRGITVYVGGYPSRSTQAALGSLGSALPPEVPFFHWSDIDVDGTWIFRTIERALGRPLLPHLMSRELAEGHGVPGKPSGRLGIGVAAGSGIADLVDYLAGPSHRTLEQEEIDPVLPLAPN